MSFPFRTIYVSHSILHLYMWNILFYNSRNSFVSRLFAWSALTKPNTKAHSFGTLWYRELEQYFLVPTSYCEPKTEFCESHKKERANIDDMKVSAPCYTPNGSRSWFSVSMIAVDDVFRKISLPLCRQPYQITLTTDEFDVNIWWCCAKWVCHSRKYVYTRINLIASRVFSRDSHRQKMPPNKMNHETFENCKQRTNI